MVNNKLLINPILWIGVVLVVIIIMSSGTFLGAIGNVGCASPSKQTCEYLRSSRNLDGNFYIYGKQTTSCTSPNKYVCVTYNKGSTCDSSFSYMNSCAAALECTDSEDNYDIYNRGKCTDGWGESPGYETCVDSNTVREDYCNTDGSIASIPVDCPNNGICLSGKCYDSSSTDFCVDNRYLCTDAYYNPSSGDLICGGSNYFDCVNNGYSSCSEDECYGNVVCNAGYEVCSDGVDFDNPNTDGDVYKCKTDGSDWQLEDTCSSSETCKEYSFMNADCISGTTYYCVATNTPDCYTWSGTGTPPTNCYTSQSDCESQFVYCYNSVNNACYTRFQNCNSGEIKYTSSSECSNRIGKCSDGTPYETCSTTQPMFCNSNGLFTDECLICGCPAGQGCAAGGSCIDGVTCTNGAIQNCMVGSCQGKQTCTNNVWGSCVKDNPNCGVTCTYSDWSVWSDSTNQCGTRTRTVLSGTGCTATTETKTCGTTTCSTYQDCETGLACVNNKCVNKCFPLFTEYDGAKDECTPQWMPIGVAIGLLALIVLSKKK